MVGRWEGRQRNMKTADTGGWVVALNGVCALPSPRSSAQCGTGAEGVAVGCVQASWGQRESSPSSLCPACCWYHI